MARKKILFGSYFILFLIIITMKPQYKYFFIINIKYPYNPYNNKIHIKQNNKYLDIIFNSIVLLTLNNLYVY